MLKKRIMWRTSIIATRVAIGVIVIFTSCKPGAQPNSYNFQDIPCTAMKFDVPEASVPVNNELLESGSVLEVINEMYKPLKHLKLEKTFRISEELDYYEYTAEGDSNRMVNIFAFDRHSKGVKISSVLTSSKLESDTRYRLQDHNVEFYKLFREQSLGITLQIEYYYVLDRIFFSKDDGFSKW